MLHIHIVVTSAPRQPGCALCAAPRPGFPSPVTADTYTAVAGGFVQPSEPGNSRFMPVLLCMLSVLLLVWGSMYGHVIECVAAVVAAILVDAIAAFVRDRRDR